MNSPDQYRLLIAREKMHVAGSMWIRQVIALVFIGLIALFFTAPVCESASAYDQPLPMPAGLELEPVGWLPRVHATAP